MLLTEGDGYWPIRHGSLADGWIAGPRVHDARVAAVCRLHGVRELWTADRDFSRFTGLVGQEPARAGLTAAVSARRAESAAEMARRSCGLPVPVRLTTRDRR